jgi:hypothetical protein
MKIVIENIKFDYNIGCRLLKLKYGNTPFGNLHDIWDDIVPMTFIEIASEITNIEQRRVAISCLGLERISQQTSPTLISSETILKKTTWVTPTGELVEKQFEDTYNLYKVEGKKMSMGTNNRMDDAYFVKFKDTSTDREYMIWVDALDVLTTNNKSTSKMELDHINAIEAIAWTFQTKVPKGNIQTIVRQGDCILIKYNDKFSGTKPRHLTEKEYREYLELES